MMTKKKKLPGSIRILGINFHIDYTTDMDKSDYGETIIEERSIKININKPKHTWRSTLRHEIFHAILGITGQSERMGNEEEEGIVIALENGVDNLMDFIDF